MNALNVPLRQGTSEWLAYRRTGVSASDIPILLGLSPYRCEADLADEKLGNATVEQTLPMKVGLALEDLIAAEYEQATGRRLQRFRSILRHPDIEWAIASPDRRVIGEKRVVELKHTGSSSRFSDGLPQDVEAQVAWQLGVLGWPVADVAVLVGGREFLRPFEVAFDAALFDNLVAVAADFRHRLAEGGPFAQNDDSLRRQYPRDNGETLPATPDLVELVEQFRAAKAAKSAAENAEKSIASALRAIVLDKSGIDGLLTYRKNADSTRTNWPAVAAAYRKKIEALLTDASMGTDAWPATAQAVLDELDTLLSIHSETVQGPRVLRLLKESRDE